MASRNRQSAKSLGNSKRSNRKRKGARGKNKSGEVTLRINKLGMFMPDRMISQFRYVPSGVLNTVGATSSSRSFRSSAYDFDPLIGSTAIAGYNEMVAFYLRWRVRSIHAHLTVTNREAFPVSCYADFSSTLFVANFLIGNAEGPRAFNKVLSREGGMDRQDLNLGATAVAVVGDFATVSDLSYAGVATANPAIMWYFNIGINSPSLAVFVNGVCLTGFFDIEVEFFDRIDLIA